MVPDSPTHGPETTAAVPETPPSLEADPNRDLFICDLADAVLKDVMQQMEHPFHSLSKKPVTCVREYRHGEHWLRITPSMAGLATIYDKDILIYAISQLVTAQNAGEEINPSIRINTHDFLIFTNRGTAGKDYQALIEALERLRGTTISTNIRTGDEEQVHVFGLIDSGSVHRTFGLDGRRPARASTTSSHPTPPSSASAAPATPRDARSAGRAARRRPDESAPRSRNRHAAPAFRAIMEAFARSPTPPHAGAPRHEQAQADPRIPGRHRRRMPSVLEEFRCSGRRRVLRGAIIYSWRVCRDSGLAASTAPLNDGTRLLSDPLPRVRGDQPSLRLKSLDYLIHASFQRVPSWRGLNLADQGAHVHAVHLEILPFQVDRHRPVSLAGAFGLQPDGSLVFPDEAFQGYLVA